MLKKIWFGLLATVVLVTTSAENSTSSTAENSIRPINVFVIGEIDNPLAEKSVLNAIKHLRAQNPSLLNEPMVELINGSDATGSITTICNVWNNKLTSDPNNMPDFILDVTRYGYGGDMVQIFTAAMGVPTLTTQYGQHGDLRGWRNLQTHQVHDLVQMTPPADIVPEVIRQLALQMNISNAAIIYDSDFTMDHKYKSLLLNVPTRHVIIKGKKTKEETAKMLSQLRDLDIVNYFILSDGQLLSDILNAAEAKNFTGNKYGWYALTMNDELTPQCACRNISVLFFKPKVSTSNQQQISELRNKGILQQPYLMSAFYYDLVRIGVGSMRLALEKNLWLTGSALGYNVCKLNVSDSTPRHSLNLTDLISEITSDPSFQPTFANFNWKGQNGDNYMQFDMDITMEIIKDGNSISSGQIGTWEGGFNSPLQLGDNTSIVKNHTAITSYRVVTIEEAPFMIYDPETGEWSGYCIELMKEIQKTLHFEYEIYVAPDNEYGIMDNDGNWNGMIRELMDKKADIALGTLSVMAERENVVDFTVPFYDLVGLSILMLKTKQPTSLFKFLTVLEDDVWLCILGSYFFTSFLMWVFDRWSPYSYHNNKEKYKEDEEKREFDLKESLWFCMTSLTPQGGGEAPKNLSGRLVAATWWLFGFIIIASYTANLAAFLTVSRLETPIESLDDLSKQYKIQYGPINPSEAYTYFKRMANIENRFYEIWKDMSLNDSLSDVERASLAVWDYPVSDKYTKMFENMKDSKFPKTREEAVKRVRKQLANHSNTEFAFIGDATAIRYLELTTCDLRMVGDEFSRKPYAIAVQQGSPLKDQFNNAILGLLNDRRLEQLKNEWWNKNPKRRNCEKEKDQSDGISIANIGGVFIVIFFGISAACATLAFEYWWFRYRPQQEAKRLAAQGNQNIKPMRFHLKPARPAFTQGSEFRSRF